jgi:segregation and condensation protein A
MRLSAFVGVSLRLMHDIKLAPLFQGPIELLLYLVREQELPIAEIPIARITDQYLHWLEAQSSLNLENASEFLLMAVVLIRLKMRSLLPRPKDENLDTGSLVSMDELVAEFKRYREAAEVLSGYETERRNVFPRAGASRVELDTSADVMILTNAFREIISKLAPKDDWVVERVQLRIEETLTELRRLVAGQRMVNLLDYLATRPTLAQVIIAFLAALEMARLGEIRVSQDELTGAILLFRRVVPAEPPAPEPGPTAPATALPG